MNIHTGEMLRAGFSEASSSVLVKREDKMDMVTSAADNHLPAFVLIWSQVQRSEPWQLNKAQRLDRLHVFLVEDGLLTISLGSLANRTCRRCVSLLCLVSRFAWIASAGEHAHFSGTCRTRLCHERMVRNKVPIINIVKGLVMEVVYHACGY